MEKTNTKITRYKYVSPLYGRYNVDIVENSTNDPTFYEAWLTKEEYGVCDLMFGMCMNSVEEFIDIVEVNLPDYARTYIKMREEEENRA